MLASSKKIQKNREEKTLHSTSQHIFAWQYCTKKIRESFRQCSTLFSHFFFAWAIKDLRWRQKKVRVQLATASRFNVFRKQIYAFRWNLRPTWVLQVQVRCGHPFAVPRLRLAVGLQFIASGRRLGGLAVHWKDNRNRVSTFVIGSVPTNYSLFKYRKYFSYFNYLYNFYGLYYVFNDLQIFSPIKLTHKKNGKLKYVLQAIVKI